MRTGRRACLRAVPLLLTAALAACAAPPATNYYRLASVPGAIQPVGGLAVNVRGIGLPAYLDQSSIVKPSGPYQFGSYSNELWAEPLGGMLQEAMVQNLAQRLQSGTITASGGAIVATADVLVEMNVLRFDPDAAGTVTLTLQIAVKSGLDRTLWQASSFTRTAPAGTTAAGEVEAMSALWGQAADQIAAMIAGAAIEHPARSTAAD